LSGDRNTNVLLREMISIEESYKFFSDALSYLNNERLRDSDDDLSYFIFEELSIDAVSFFHEWTLDRLIEAKKIPADIRTDVLLLRTQILEQLEKTNSIGQYRKEKNWDIIRNQAQEIQNKILRMH